MIVEGFKHSFNSHDFEVIDLFLHKFSNNDWFFFINLFMLSHLIEDVRASCWLSNSA